MVQKIQIICSSPGMRRNGVTHPASAFYDEGHWTEKQMEAFKADPAFTIREVTDGDTGTTEADFELRVKSEVERLSAEKANLLQAAFDQAVSDKVAEQLALIKTDYEQQISDLTKQLGTANDALAKVTVEPAGGYGSGDGAASESAAKPGKSKA
ncbi:hypothetical protein SAMN05421890_1561 [Ensifer adhaerens]|nr:hypothetical protein SAMN05421890_1561 [Ensifer adhaerens]